MKRRYGLALAVALGCVIACAARPQTAMPESGARPVEPPAQDPKAQITALDEQITVELERMHVVRPAVAPCTGPGCAHAMNATEPPMPPTPPGPSCPAPVTPQCQDSCTIASSICGNQVKICELAKQLANDSWAADKCASAQASCQAANARCCACK